MDEKFVCVRHVVEDVLSSKRGEGTYVSGGARTHVASIRSNKAEDADKETLMFNVYMAGPINGCTDDEATNWREQLPKDVREACELHQDVDSDEFYFIDPMARDFRGIEGDNTDLIVHGDLEDIQMSQFVVANAWQISAGTMMEVFYAAYVLRKPVVVVLPPDAKVSPWLKYFAYRVVNSLPQAAGALVSLARDRDKFDKRMLAATMDRCAETS